MDGIAGTQATGPLEPGGMTRRRFLQLVGVTMGAAAAFNVLSAWGQVPYGGQLDPPTLQGNGNGTKVIVVGAGPGGCPAAYELMKAGYDVTILEARDRVGGHAFTVRGGSKSMEYGKGEQTCDWPEGLWFDAGPSRVPFFHHGFFHYVKEFGIPLVDYNNINLAAWCYAENIKGNLNGKRMRLYELQADMGGYTSQLLAAAQDKGALDQQLQGEDAEMLREYLISWGLLSKNDLKYHKSDHRGYTRVPDTQTPGEIADPPPLSDLLPFADAVMDAMGSYLAATPVFDWQRTLVSPRDGVQALYEEGFHKAFGDKIKLNAEVTEIRQSDTGVRIVYTDKTTGQSQEVTGDYCMCNIPLSVLIKLKTDFSKEFTDLIRRVPYAMALRLGIAYKRRFWEEDDYIYGGQSFSNIPNMGIIGYPNHDYATKGGGVLLNTYVFDLEAAYVSSMSFEDRVRFALENSAKIHPQVHDEFISGFSVAWHQEPYSLGAWPDYSDVVRAEVMPKLQEPDGRVYLVGEHLSYVNAWMEGAVQAAWLMVDKLHQRVMQG